jgi:hypothetical protein
MIHSERSGKRTHKRSNCSPNLEADMNEDVHVLRYKHNKIRLPLTERVQTSSLSQAMQSGWPYSDVNLVYDLLTSTLGGSR